MSEKNFWDKRKVEIASDIIKNSTSIHEGVVKVSTRFKKTITEDALRAVFRRFNVESNLSRMIKHTNKYTEQDYLCQKRAEEAVEILNRYNDTRSAVKEICKKLDVSVSTIRKDIRAKFGKNARLSDFLRNKATDISETQVEKLIAYVKKANSKKHKITFRNLCDQFDMAPAKMESIIDEAVGFGYKLNIDDDLLKLDRELPVQKIVTSIQVPTNEKRRIRLGIVSDTHFGSEAALTDELNHFVDTAYNKYQVRTFLHCGDVLAGNRVYKGQEAEVTHWGCDAQVNSAVTHLPKKPNLEWYGILGNHDVSFIKLAGIDVGDKLAKLRPDFHYIGALKEKININGVEIELAHLKSSAHARSYSLEKHVYRTYSKSNQPQALFCGHKHANGYFEVQRIHTFLVPCFEDPSLFLQYSDFMPSIGGIIVDFVLDEYANIIRVEPSFHLYHHKDEDVLQIQTNEIKDTKSNGKQRKRKKK